MTTPPSKYVFDVVFTEPELLLIAEDAWQADPTVNFARKRSRKHIAVLYLVVLVCLGVFVFTVIQLANGTASGSLPTTALVLSLVFGGVLMGVVGQLQEPFSIAGRKRLAEAWIQQVLRNYPDRRVRFLIDSECIRIETALVSTSMRWPIVTEVFCGPSAVTLVTARNGFEVILPSSAIPADQRLALEQDLKAWLAANGGGDEERISRYLVARDLDCPGCKYNLRGTRSGACPECGFKLNATTLPQAFPERKG